MLTALGARALAEPLVDEPLPGQDAARGPASGGAVDLSPLFDQRGLAVRDQGTRGTCSVFTVTRALEFALTDGQPRQDRLSVEYLNWASNRVTGQDHDGSFFSDLWTGYERFGICDEKTMPYENQFEPRRRPSREAREQAFQLRDAQLHLHWIKPWDPHRGLTEEQFLAIKATLRAGHPVCGGFLWPKQTQWVDDVLQMATRDGVRDGHSVLLVGFRDEPAQPGGGIFWIQNTSKGPRKGAMSYEYVRTYMNDAAWIGRAADGQQP